MAEEAEDKPAGTKPDKRNGKLRMADLARESGVPKSTILYYLSEGLLPEPERPKPNVALYDPICVDLIRYIRGAQELHRYPLVWIRSNIEHIMAGVSPDELLLLGQRVLGVRSEDYSTKAEVARAFGIDGTSIDRYVEIALIWPLGPDSFDEYDKALIGLLAEAENAGIPPDAFGRVVDAARLIDDTARDVADRYIGKPTNPKVASTLVDLLGRLQPYLVRRISEQRGL